MNLKTQVGLLVVDVQVGFRPSPGLIAKISDLASGYLVVVQTRFSNPPDSLFRTALNWHDDGGELALRIPGAKIFDKTGYGLPAHHISALKLMDCSEWHICGLDTDACVLACAFSLWDAGIRPVILPDACSSPLHQEGIAVAQRQFGKASDQSITSLIQ